MEYGKQIQKFKWIRFKTKLDYLTFSVLRGRSIYLIKCDFTIYTASIEAGIIPNSAECWKYVPTRCLDMGIPDHISCGGVTSFGGKQICETFCDYFASVFEKFNHMGMNTSPLQRYQSMRLANIVTESQILDRLLSINVKKGAGPDGVSPILIKECANELSLPLCIIFNKSLSEGVFPSEWKKALVVPIYKSGDRTLAESYRPISKLSIFAKIFESLMYDVIFANVKNVIIKQQHGFYRGRSVTTNLMEYIHYISESLDNRVQVDSAYTDFSKAFDRVDHNKACGCWYSRGLISLAVILRCK